MAMVKVYRFKVYDIRNDSYDYPSSMATQKYIEKLDGATRIEGTEIEIDESLLTNGLTARNFDPSAAAR